MAEYKIVRKPVPRFNEDNGFYTTKSRSKLMSRIKSSNTDSEIRLRKLLYRSGYRYRVNVKSLPGKPDIVIKKYKLIIFVDGEFWHGYNWLAKSEKIKANRGFWIPKIDRNMERDMENNKKLKDLGWNVIRFWDHEIKKDIDACLYSVIANIKGNQ